MVETGEGRSPSHQNVLGVLRDRGALAVCFGGSGTKERKDVECRSPA